jgi:hypothetical protein
VNLTPTDAWFAREYHRGVAKELESVPVGETVAALEEDFRVHTPKGDATEVAARLDAELRTHRLGRATASSPTEITCRTPVWQWGAIARRLVNAVLVRAGFDAEMSENIAGTWYRRRIRRREADPPKYEFGLRLIKKSRTPPTVGDIFIYKPDETRNAFGCVVRDDADGAVGKPCMILYFFAIETASPSPPAALSPQSLLIPPVIHDNTMWREGVFATVEHRSLRKADVLRRHCFLERFPKLMYLDEHRRPTAPSEPCGEAGCPSPFLLDLRLCDAWGEPGPPLWSEDEQTKR